MAEYGAEVARFLLPTPVRGLDRLVDWMEAAYGRDLVLHQEDTWIVITQPRN